MCFRMAKWQTIAPLPAEIPLRRTTAAEIVNAGALVTLPPAHSNVKLDLSQSFTHAREGREYQARPDRAETAH